MNLKWRLSQAQGYLELGMVAEAESELNAVPAELQGEMAVLGLRALVLQELKQWVRLQPLAHELTRRQPHNAGWWITWAYATRRAECIEAAEVILQQAEHLHPEEAMIQFNLSCYACVQGNVEEARRRLNRAIALEAKCAEMAKVDEDLKMLRVADSADRAGN